MTWPRQTVSTSLLSVLNSLHKTDVLKMQQTAVTNINMNFQIFNNLSQRSDLLCLVSGWNNFLKIHFLSVIVCAPEGFPSMGRLEEIHERFASCWETLILYVLKTSPKRLASKKGTNVIYITRLKYFSPQRILKPRTRRIRFLLQQISSEI